MFRQLLIMMLVLGFALCGSQNILAAKKVAFLVGVNKYKKPGFRNLSYAERDVSEMSKQLKTFGFDVTLILGKEATKTKLESTIDKLVEPLTKEDLILVMLTGHGVQRTGGDAFYCPFDAIAEKDETLFSLSKLLKTTLAPNVGTKLLLIDACRNDPDAGRGRSGGIQGKVIALPEDTAVMFSCRSGQQSFENDQIKHGIFTFCVLEALQGGAINHGEISWSDLQSRVKRKMSSSDMTKYIPKGRRQTPIPAGGVPYTVLARVEIVKPKPVEMSKPNSVIMSNPKVEEKAKPKNPLEPSLLVVPFIEEQAKAKQTEWAIYLKRKPTITNSIGMTFNIIPPGEFKMGHSKSSEELSKLLFSKAKSVDDEYLHTVRLTKPYYLGVTEVTQRQWKSVMRTEPWKDKKDIKEGDDYPATFVSWEDAQKFIEKLGQSERVSNYRLPTEAEWEYACRAGSDEIYCFGDSPQRLESYAWYEKNSMGYSKPFAHRVKLRRDNIFGLYDIHGNVSEWCLDWYGKDYYKKSPLSNPSGPITESDTRVFRGGDFANSAWLSRSAHRSSYAPKSKNDLIGFRLVRTP